MTRDEKIARHKEEIAKLQKEKKAERERQRRAHGKENDKKVVKLMQKYGYNGMKDCTYENLEKYCEKYADKIMYFIEHGETEKKEVKKAEINAK